MHNKPTEETPTPFDIIKGTLAEHEREALIAAIIVAIGASAAAATYTAKKHPEYLSPWKLVGDSRLGQGISELRILHRARSNRQEHHEKKSTRRRD